MRLPAVVLAGVVLWSACGGGVSSTVVGPAEDRPALADYASEVDAISVQYPSAWHLAKKPLAAGLIGDDVEILGLATSPPPAAVDPCSTYKWSFREHDRRYTAVVAAALPLGDERRAELEQLWASLELRPVPQPPATGAVIGQEYFHVLSTHCGVEFDRFDGQEWQADPVLDTGTGSPPPGWGNPLTAGVMVRLGPDQARFTVRHTDLTADFRIRRADDPPFYCA